MRILGLLLLSLVLWERCGWSLVWLIRVAIDDDDHGVGRVKVRRR